MAMDFKLPTQRFAWEIESNCSDSDREPVIVIAGKKRISWEDFGQMMVSLESLQFKLEISDRSDEVRHVRCDECRRSRNTYRRIAVPGRWRGALTVGQDFPFVIQSLC
ncbi:MAG: hypothetical protein ACLPXB_04115 [Thiobacillaceae bacterium]